MFTLIQAQKPNVGERIDDLDGGQFSNFDWLHTLYCIRAAYVDIFGVYTNSRWCDSCTSMCIVFILYWYIYINIYIYILWCGYMNMLFSWNIILDILRCPGQRSKVEFDRAGPQWTSSWGDGKGWREWCLPFYISWFLLSQWFIVGLGPGVLDSWDPPMKAIVT